MTVVAAPWRATIGVYTRPHWARSLLDLATSVVAYLSLLVATAFASQTSVFLALAPFSAVDGG